MDYNKYDDIQAGLGTVASNFQTHIKKILAKSSADEETKKLVEECCTCTFEAIKYLSLLISGTAQLLSD